jgi:heptosyltransferase-1
MKLCSAFAKTIKREVMDKPVKPTFGKYYVTSIFTALVLQCIDTFLIPLEWLRGKTAISNQPKSILISNMGGLGDVTVATSVIPVLKSAFPNVKIGFLVSKTSAPLINGHPDIDYIHLLDHWFSSRKRNKISLMTLKYWTEILHLVRDIRGISYDVAIELFPRIQNTIPLSWLASVPFRLGYTSGGCGPLLTHKIDWVLKNQHVSKWHFDLLRMLPLSEDNIAKAKVSITLNDSEEFAGVYHAVGGNIENDFILVHIGALESKRKWMAPRWRELAIKLINDGYNLVFTGSGDNDSLEISSVITGLNSCINLCDKLTLTGYVAAIRSSKLVLCVDTVAQHVASGFDKPTVVIANGRHPYIWHPMHERHKVVMHQVPCIPCFRPRCCRQMECIHGIKVNDVYNACRELMGCQEREDIKIIGDIESFKGEFVGRKCENSCSEL